MEPPIRFASYELDPVAGELRKAGVRVRLAGQPLDVLALLASRPGEVVTREELKDALWPDETFVDFDNGVNSAVRRIRRALDDSATDPRFIETLPKRGYRFIGEVEPVDTPPSPQEEAAEEARKREEARRVEEEQQRGRRRRLLAATLVVTLLVAIYVLWPTNDETPLRFTERPLTFDEAIERHPSLSPDGTRVAYTWRRVDAPDGDIYVKVVDEPAAKAQPLTQGPENDIWPAWSPDGARLAFIRGGAAPLSYRLMVVAATGGEPEPLCTFWGAGAYFTKPSWSPTGQEIVFSGRLEAGKPRQTNRLLVYSFETRQVQALDLGEGKQRPVFSPDGKTLAFHRATTGGNPGISVVDVDESLAPKGTERPIIPGQWWGYSWSPDGQALFLVDRDKDPGLLRIAALGSGQPEFLHPFDGEAVDLSVGLGPTGRLRAVVAVESADVDLMRVSLETANAQPEPLIRSNRMERHPEYSPDGQRIAFESDRSGRREIWLGDGSGQGLRPVAEGPTLAGGPRWSPDSRYIAFSDLTKNDYQIYLLDVEARGGRRPVGPGIRPGWSSNGLWLYYFSKVSEEGQLRTQIWRVRLDGGSERDRIADLGPDSTGGFGFGLIRESPDGRTLYWTHSGRLMSAPLGDDGRVSAPPRPIAADVLKDGFSILGGADAHEVYYCTSRNEIKRFRSESGKSETLRRLDDTIESGCSVSPDGRWLIYDRRVRSGYDLKLLEAVE